MTRIARTALLGALALAVGAMAYAPEWAPTKEATPKQTSPGATVKKEKTIWSPGEVRDTTHITPPTAKEGRTWVKVSGEVINLFCYLDSRFADKSHRECAIARTRGGVPQGLLTQLGLLTQRGEIYILFPNHEWAMDKEQVTYAKPYQRLVDWTARRVQAAGYLVERKGLRGIEVYESKLLTEDLPPAGGLDSSMVQPPDSTGSEAP